MEMMTLRARKDNISIEVNMFGMMGTIKIQAKSSIKEKLNIHCERRESPPPQRAAVIMSMVMAVRRKGIIRYIMRVTGIEEL